MGTRATRTERRHGTTRREILDALRRSAGLTADQLADALGVTAMAVRKHLAALQEDGLLTARVERRPVGRPVHVYTLTPRAQDRFPQHYQDLTTELLDDLRALDGEEKVNTLFRRRAERAYTALEPALAGRPLAERLTDLARYLDEQGFLAGWEETADGDYLLKEHNCAIFGVAQCTPEACACELDLFQRLFADAGVQVERERHLLNGDHLCCYRLRATPPPDASS
ncbi:MAG: transcriptional regulator [Chloroflexota bacterium]|nr:transcriptional regulator [Chloroflexota bacterium]